GRNDVRSVLADSRRSTMYCRFAPGSKLRGSMSCRRLSHTTREWLRAGITILARLDSARIPPALATRPPFVYPIDTMGLTQIGPKNGGFTRNCPFTALMGFDAQNR